MSRLSTPSQERAVAILREAMRDVPAVDTSSIERAQRELRDAWLALEACDRTRAELNRSAATLPNEIASLETQEAEVEALVDLGRCPAAKLEAIRSSLASERSALAEAERKRKSYDKARDTIRQEIDDKKRALPDAKTAAIAPLESVMLAKLRASWRATLELHHAYLYLQALAGKDTTGSASTLSRVGQGIFYSERDPGLAKEIGLSGERDFGLAGGHPTDPAHLFSVLRKDPQ